MAQTHHIIFKQPSSAKMGASFKVLLTSLERFNQVKSGYTVQLDMSKVRFAKLSWNLQMSFYLSWKKLS